MQIKTTARYHHISNQMQKKKEKNETSNEILDKNKCWLVGKVNRTQKNHILDAKEIKI